MRTVVGCVLALAGCTESGESPQPTEPIQVTLTTQDVRVVSVPVALDCGNGQTACSGELQFFSNELRADDSAAITLVVVERPDTCKVFTFQPADGFFPLCKTTQLMCGFIAQPGQVLDITVSCSTSP